MKLKRIILLLLTVMFSFSYGEVFAKDGNSLKKASISLQTMPVKLQG